MIQRLKKHQKIVTLAIAKRETNEHLLSKALANNQVSDTEFQSIMTEFSQNNVLKEAVRAKLTRQPSRPDVESKGSISPLIHAFSHEMM